jgi:hypothetical protein
MHSLERKKTMLPVLHRIPDNVVLTGEDINKILSVVFINKPMVKKPRTGVSPNKPLNPQPTASVVPCTHAAIRASPIIHIQDNPESKTFPSTFIIEHPPSSPQPQSPLLETTSPPQTPNPELMRLDQPEQVERELPETTQEFPKSRSKVYGPNPVVPEQSM